MKKEYRNVSRTVSLILSIVGIIFLIVQIGFGLFAAYRINGIGDQITSQHQNVNKQIRSENEFEKQLRSGCLTYNQFMNLDAAAMKLFEKSTNGLTMWCRKKKEPECLTYNQFMNLDAASKTLFEKSTNGLTMWCRKKKEPECLTYDQFVTQDAESKKLFEKSANGLTMCRKKKDQQSANDALKSEKKP